MKFNALANNFSAGEWSEKLVARSDAQEFNNACLKMQNFIPKVSGGAFKRNGTRKLSTTDQLQDALNGYMQKYLSPPPDYKQAVKCIPYILSTGARKIIILGAGYLANDIPHKGAFIYDVDTGAVNTINTSAYNFIPDPEDVHYTQVGDVMVLVWRYGIIPAVIFPSGSSFIAKTLYGFATTEYGLRIHEVYPFRPIVALGSGGPTLTTSGTTGNITVTSSTPFFSIGHIDAVFKFSSGGSTGSARVISFTSNTSVVMSVASTLPLAGTYGLAPGTSWEESSWSVYRGWPATVTTYQGRLIFGGNQETPARIWASRIGSFFYFNERPFEQEPGFTTYTTDNSRAFQIEPADAFASRISSLAARENLYVITERSEIVGSSTQGAFGPLDFRFEVAGAFGGTRTQPVPVGNSILYVSNIGNKVKEIIYDDNARQFRVNDLSFTADHIFTPNKPLKSIFEMSPSTYNDVASLYLMGSDSNGPTCAVLNIDKQYKQNALWRFVSSDDIVWSTAFIPQVDDLVPKQIMLVGRGSNIYIEELDNETFEIYPETGRRLFLDCSLTLTASYTAPNFTITGLSHLNGLSVSVVQENQGKVVASNLVVSGGSITFPDTNVVSPAPGLSFVVGLPYSAILTTYPIEIGNQIPETSQGRIKRVDEMVIKLYRTIKLKYGKTEADAVNTVDLDLNNPLNSPPTLFTGSYVANLDQGYDRQFSVTMVSDEPYPCNILAVVARGVTYD
jgi:hypothetical protein